MRDHLADVETMALTPEHQKFAADFNSDNGTGRVRWVWIDGTIVCNERRRAALSMRTRLA